MGSDAEQQDNMINLNNTTTERRYLRVPQILREYGLPRDRLYTALRTGELPSINLGSEGKKSYLVQRSAVEQWLERLTTGAP